MWYKLYYHYEKRCSSIGSNFTYNRYHEFKHDSNKNTLNFKIYMYIYYHFLSFSFSFLYNNIYIYIYISIKNFSRNFIYILKSTILTLKK